jgi:hypothetical protein
MTPISPLYKFSSVAGALSILEGGSLWTKSPLDFNDPFEVLPAFDEDRKNEMVTSRKRFYRSFGVSSGDLVPGGGEENIPVEGFIRLAEIYHDPFFESLYRQYRVLCFSETCEATLLWSHYGDAHKGIALGFDVAKGDFPLGQKPGGIRVDYCGDREELKLPIEYYQHAGFKVIESPPDGYARTVSGMLIQEADQSARCQESLETLLSHKDDAWKYEREIRFLYDVSVPGRDMIRGSQGQDIAAFQPEAVTEVVFGFRCSVDDVEKLAPVLSKKYPHARLCYVDLHPYKFEVRVHDGDLARIRFTQGRRRENFRMRGDRAISK